MSDVTDGVENLVCGTEVTRLADNEAAYRVEDIVHDAQRLLHAEAGDGLELVQCASSVTKSSP